MSDVGFDDALGASYRLVEIVGRGAVGEVWRAVDRRTDETVAAKLQRAEHVSDRDLVSRFVQERALLTGVRHPNLVSVRDLVVEGDRLGIVMDFVDGGSARDLLAEQGPLPPARAIEIVAAVLDGLGAAHDRGLVHRDIKPDNVLLSGSTTRLTDFGIARIVGEGPKTSTGLLGTPEYMSPELLEVGTAGPPADVYGVGIMLYELLAGRTPFAGPGTDYTIAHRHVSSAVPTLSIDPKLWAVLIEMLEKDPRRRPPARQAAYRLRELLPGLADAPALQPQAAPEEFAAAHGPMTVVRGITPEAAEPEVAGDVASLDDLDLGTPGQATVVRPMRKPDRPTRRHAPEPEPVDAGPWWRQRRTLAIVLGALAVIAVVALVAVVGLPHRGHGTTSASSQPQTATQRDAALPTGLTISRNASYDPQTHTVDLSITYATQNSPLTGPFLEVIKGTGTDCPTLAWHGATQSQNLPSVTGIDTACSWSVNPGRIPKQSSKTVEVTVSLDFGDGSSASGDTEGSPVQRWLDRNAAATTKTVADPQITSTAYAAQRLQSVEVVTPASTVTGKVVPISLLPIWPKGVDKLDPLLRSPSIGRPSSLLTAVAGGERGVRFSDSCNGALAISSGGRVVTALTVNHNCKINAQVGNLTDLASSPFSIENRSS
ncbi:MAG TPA: serine/threonine-protein kinase [Marmoricola sp.]